MVSEVYIWSIRMNSWVGAAGGTSDIKFARVFDEAEALDICRRQRDGEGNMQSFPVPRYLIEAITR